MQNKNHKATSTSTGANRSVVTKPSRHQHAYISSFWPTTSNKPHKFSNQLVSFHLGHVDQQSRALQLGTLRDTVNYLFIHFSLLLLNWHAALHVGIFFSSQTWLTMSSQRVAPELKHFWHGNGKRSFCTTLRLAQDDLLLRHSSTYTMNVCAAATLRLPCQCELSVSLLIHGVQACGNHIYSWKGTQGPAVHLGEQ